MIKIPLYYFSPTAQSTVTNCAEGKGDEGMQCREMRKKKL
jgi:hypothetical protein